MQRFFVILFVIASASLRAATIRIASDLVDESNNRTPANVFIVPNSEWAVAPDGAGWISYANTGMGAGAISPPDSSLHPWAIFTESFFLPGAINTGSVRVWADDTAAVQLDGVAAGPSAQLVLGNACAAGPIGCQPKDFADISLNGLSQGEHSLTFAVYQIGSGPFGLLYSGSVNSTGATPVANTPEPATFLLLGGGMLGLAAIMRRRKR